MGGVFGSESKPKKPNIKKQKEQIDINLLHLCIKKPNINTSKCNNILNNTGSNLTFNKCKNNTLDPECIKIKTACDDQSNKKRNKELCNKLYPLTKQKYLALKKSK